MKFNRRGMIRIKMPAMRATNGVMWAIVRVMGISLTRVNKRQNAAVVPTCQDVVTNLSSYSVSSSAKADAPVNAEREMGNDNAIARPGVYWMPAFAGMTPRSSLDAREIRDR